jgi:hypothetical protein
MIESSFTGHEPPDLKAVFVEKKCEAYLITLAHPRSEEGSMCFAENVVIEVRAKPGL